MRPRTPFPRLAVAGVAVVASVILGACAGDGRLPFASPASSDAAHGHAGGTVGSPAGMAPSSTGPAARPVAAPAVSPAAMVRQGSATPAGTAPRKNDASAPVADLALGKKRIPLSTVELDQQCAKVVAPFTLSGNAVDLLSLAGQELGDSVSSAIEGLGNKSAATAKAAPTAKATKHHISASVRASAVRMNWLPMPLEVQYGDTLLDKMREQGRVLDRDTKLGRKIYPAGDELLAQVLAAVKEPHDYTFRLVVSSQSGENAMALPGGLLIVDKALITEPALRDKAWFAIAHEIGHVLQRHETRALQARIVDAYSVQANLSELLKAIRATGGSSAEAAGILKLVTAGKVQFERHFEQQELQSDACAVRLLDSTFADDGQLRKSLQAFIGGLPKPEPVRQRTAEEAKQAAMGDMVALVTRPIDRHPSTERRIANLNEVLATVKARRSTEASAEARMQPQ